MSVFFKGVTVVVLGGGDLASGVIYRLYTAGFPVVVTELAAPLFVRRAVCFGEAIYSDEITVEGVTARLAETPADARRLLELGAVPVLVDPEGVAISRLGPVAVVDARMEKRNLGVTREDAPLVVGLGPGFVAGEDVHAVVETNRGHDLGRVIREGAAEPDTGRPGKVKGMTHTRVLRAPADGHVHARFEIGDSVRKDETIATVGEHEIIAAFDGVLRGIIHEQVSVKKGLKVGDLDPRGERRTCFTISDKALSVGGGVVQAVLSSEAVRERIARPT